jgi:tetratricopeptide (TPR) repeat protein
MRLALLIAAALVALGPSVGRVARADVAPMSAAERTRLSKLSFELARSHFDHGDYDRAIAEFLQAYGYKPIPLFLYNAAQTALRADKLELALGYYERYLREDPQAPERAEVEERIATLRARLAPAPSAPPAATVVAAPASAAPAVTATPPPRRSRRWLWITVGVLGGLAVAGGITAAVVLTRSPSAPDSTLGNFAF